MLLSFPLLRVSFPLRVSHILGVARQISSHSLHTQAEGSEALSIRQLTGRNVARRFRESTALSIYFFLSVQVSNGTLM